jgi:6-phosphogluconolactonase
MKRSAVFVALALSASLAIFASPSGNLKAGAVYVMTNQTVNSIMAFSRDNKTGALSLVDTELTGGAGNPVPIPPDPPTDPLASQGSLVLDEGNEYLYAVNAGSNEISVLEVSRNELNFVQKISSGGTRPISIALYDGLLYVLNEGGTPNITGFYVDEDGTLTPIPDSTQPLIGGTMADPAQVGFNEDGTLLVVTEKMGNRLDTYEVSKDGVAGPPSANPSSGMTPFGFAFSGGGTLVVSEAFGGAPGAGAASSYTADSDGDLSVVSGSVPNGQTASCWVVITNGGRYAFISNTLSGTISSYRVDAAGTLHLLQGVAANTGAGSSPIDMALSVNSKYLYILENGSHTVSAYSIDNRGGLSFVGEFGTLPMGSQGIAAK